MNRFVAFSGGKDSTALALIMPDAVPVFADTRWEFPEIYAHLDNFERVTGREVVRICHPGWPGGLPEYIRHHAFMPGHGARFCTRIFKIEAFNLWLGDKLPAELCIALRADEPEEMRVGNLTDTEGLTIRYPLREMGVGLADVLRITTSHELFTRYPVYMVRGGCIGCFYKRRSEVVAMAHLKPDVICELKALEEEVQDERGKFAYMFPNVGQSIGDVLSQPLLFDANDVWREAGNQSDVGQSCGLFCHR